MFSIKSDYIMGFLSGIVYFKSLSKLYHNKVGKILAKYSFQTVNKLNLSGKLWL